MEFYRLCILFLIGGVGGWVLELFFRRFVSMKKWVNPGFLAGPLLPLYGFGVICLYYLCSIDYTFSGSISKAWGEVLCIISIGLAMTLVEFIAGIIFIKGMNIKLWDYTNRPLNIMGIICPEFSLIWCLCGALYRYLAHPGFVFITDFFLNNAIYFLFILGILYGILLVDCYYSFDVAFKLKKAIKSSNLVLEWDKVKTSFAEYHKKMKQHAPWIFAFSTSKVNLVTLASSYVEKAMEFDENRRRNNEIKNETKLQLKKMRKER